MVESSHIPQEFEDALQAFKEKQRASFADLKLSLPKQQMKRAEERIPELITLRAVLLEIMEQGHILSRELMNIIFTQFEKDDHDKLLHG